MGSIFFHGMRRGGPRSLRFVLAAAAGAAAAGLFLAACTQLGPVLSEEDETALANCTITQSRFSTDVQPVLEANCVECHGRDNVFAGHNLNDYNTVRSLAQSGLLRGVVTHAPGFRQMPYQRPKLDACSIRKITLWIEEGAQNN